MNYESPAGAAGYGMSSMQPPTNLSASFTASPSGSHDDWEVPSMGDGDSSGDDDAWSPASSSRRDEKRPARAGYDDALHAPPPHTGRSLMGFNKPSSTTSDFTKRKKWAAAIVDELADFLHVLGPAGNVVFASPSIGMIAGYKPEDIVGRQLDAFIHHDDVDAFNRDLRQSVATGLPLRLHYRLRKKDGRYVIVEILGHAYYAPGSAAPSVEDCKCVFAMGRPYPSRQAEEVDSFLELKLENEKLRQDLERMRSEVENDPEARAALQRLKQAPRQDALENQHVVPSGGGGFSGHNTRHETRAAPMSKNISAPDNGRRRKKQRTEEGEFVCRDCGTIDSPEWRKGPLGPKTLCNACGLRWAKKSKQMANAK